MPRATVLWDFDGTLAERPGLWSTCLVEALAEVQPGHELSAADVRPGLQDGFPWHAPLQTHLEVTTAEQWWDLMYPLFQRALEGAGVASDVARRASREVRSLYVDAEKWVVFADSRAALARLQEADVSNVIVSNHVPELSALLDALGFTELVVAVHSSAITGFEKPNVRMFELALAERLGEPVWMVGDSQTADIEPIERLGHKGILVKRAGPGRDSEADRAVDEILTLIGQRDNSEIPSVG